MKKFISEPLILKNYWLRMKNSENLNLNFDVGLSNKSFLFGTDSKTEL
jgi:hypothetical protein